MSKATELKFNVQLTVEDYSLLLFSLISASVKEDDNIRKMRIQTLYKKIEKEKEPI